MVTLSVKQKENILKQISETKFDEKLNLVLINNPHEKPIAHLTEAHCGPTTSGFILMNALVSENEEVVYNALGAIIKLIDQNPESKTFGCPKWYYESPTVYDTNAAFFTTFPLVCSWIARPDWREGNIGKRFQKLFYLLSRWFLHCSHHPKLYYPNKCYADCILLYALGKILNDKEILEAGEGFCRRWFEYWYRRGCGWGENHSIAYVNVLIRMSLLILAIGCPNDIRKNVVAFLDDIMDFVNFHDGRVPVPGIRGKHAGKVYAEILPWFDLDSPKLTGKAIAALVITPLAGYTPPKPKLTVPRERIHRTFDEHYSVSYIDANARLGTLSQWPIMPNIYHHNDWGLGSSVTPAAFIADDCNSGFLQWFVIDEDGKEHHHPKAADFGPPPFENITLVKNISFLPDVIHISHQKQRAAIIFREIHHLHSPIIELTDRWCIPDFQGKVFINDKEWAGQEEMRFEEWCILDYGNTAIGIYPLGTRVIGDSSPKQGVASIKRENKTLFIELNLYKGQSQLVTEHLLFTGWCVVIFNDMEEYKSWQIEESFTDDGEIPREYNELIRKVSLKGPETSLTLIRDPLTKGVHRE